jgi:hypothetical protein
MSSSSYGDLKVMVAAAYVRGVFADIFVFAVISRLPLPVEVMYQPVNRLALIPMSAHAQMPSYPE